MGLMPQYSTSPDCENRTLGCKLASGQGSGADLSWPHIQSGSIHFLWGLHALVQLKARCVQSQKLEYRKCTGTIWIRTPEVMSSGWSLCLTWVPGREECRHHWPPWMLMRIPSITRSYIVALIRIWSIQMLGCSCSGITVDYAILLHVADRHPGSSCLM